MGYKYEWRTRDEVLATANDLRKAAEKLVALAEKMKDASFGEAIFPWSQATFDAMQAIRELPGLSDVMLDNQIAAKEEKKPSKYEKAMKKSEKDVARRAAKAQAKAASEVPPPAEVKKVTKRPRKHAT